jgi:dTDP-4-dehydrorhamnose 3,5-epimerase
VTSDRADFLYRTTHCYEPSSEGAVRWGDHALCVGWPTDTLNLPLSAKDLAAPSFADARTFD